MYVRGYLQGSENGRVVTIEQIYIPIPLTRIIQSLYYAPAGRNINLIQR